MTVMAEVIFFVGSRGEGGGRDGGGTGGGVVVTLGASGTLFCLPSHRGGCFGTSISFSSCAWPVTTRSLLWTFPTPRRLWAGSFLR